MLHSSRCGLNSLRMHIGGLTVAAGVTSPPNMAIFIPYWSICNCCFVTFTEERTGKTKHLVRMLEFLEGVSVIRVGVTDDVSYKGGIFVAKFSNAVQVLELMKAIPTFLTIICISASMVAPESFIYSTI